MSRTEKQDAAEYKFMNILASELKEAGIPSQVLPLRVDPSEAFEGYYIITSNEDDESISIDYCPTDGVIYVWDNREPAENRTIGQFDINNPTSIDRMIDLLKTRL